MNYLTKYRERNGICEFCKHSERANRCCIDCNGGTFEDRLSLLDFIREDIDENVEKIFAESEKGKKLIEEREKAREEYARLDSLYYEEIRKLKDNAMKQVEQQMNNIHVEYNEEQE